MKIINFLRKPYLSMMLAALVLYVSCNQYDPVVETKHAFDSTVFSMFKNSKHFDNVLNNLKSLEAQSRQGTVLEKNKEILATVNTELGTSLILPEKLLKLSVETDVDRIYEIALENGWMTQEDVSLIKNLANDIQANGFDVAIGNYENQILGLNLSNAEFVKKNVFINTLKSLNYQYPNLFVNSAYERSWWRCALACTGLVAATASLAGCATGAACALAVTLVIAAGLAVYEHCGVSEAVAIIIPKHSYYVETI